MLNRQSLPRGIAETLEQWILQRILKPGDQLRELHLASRLGTSQSPVREALRLLEERGLVTHTPNKGTTVADFSTEDVRQLIAVRTPLEVLALQLARERALPDNRAELAKRLKRLSRAAVNNDPVAYHEAHADFHRYLWTMGRNQHLANALERLCIPLWALYLRHIVSSRHGALSGMRAHKPFVDFVSSDATSASEADNVVHAHLSRIGYEDVDVD